MDSSRTSITCAKRHGRHIGTEFHQLITVYFGQNIGTQGHNLTQLDISWAQVFQYEPELLRRNTPGNGMLFQNGCDLSQPFSISAFSFFSCSSLAINSPFTLLISDSFHTSSLCLNCLFVSVPPSCSVRLLPLVLLFSQKSLFILPPELPHSAGCFCFLFFNSLCGCILNRLCYRYFFLFLQLPQPACSRSVPSQLQAAPV